jgi:hypothetical protein
LRRRVEVLQSAGRKVTGPAEARGKAGHAARAVPGARAALRC